MLLFVARWQVGRLGQRKLDATTQQLNAAEPGWQLDAIFSERQKNAPPPEQNAAQAVLDIAERIPKEGRELHRVGGQDDVWPSRYSNNHLPPQTAIDFFQAKAPPTAAIRDEAVRLREKHSGHYPLHVADDPTAITLPHLDKARTVLALLEYDACLAALEKRPARGILAARACLAIARSIGDEPILISQLVRIAAAKVSAQSAMQVHAWTEPTEGLAELQAELLAEADVPFFRIGIRGERAMLDKLFTGLENGKITAEQAFRYFDVGNPGPQHYAAFRAYHAFLPGDHAKCLQLITEYHEAAKLPHHEQLTAMKKIPNPKSEPDYYRHLITCLALPACDKVAEAGLRACADLLSAATCIACERFRQKHGHWPNELAELVPAFLPAVPTNPFDGKPITYRQFHDRIAIYCYWANSQPPRAEIPPEFLDGATTGLGIGYRAWNADQRGLPPKESPEEKQEP